jgi:hypothetical protein
MSCDPVVSIPKAPGGSKPIEQGARDTLSSNHGWHTIIYIEERSWWQTLQISPPFDRLALAAPPSALPLLLLLPYLLPGPRVHSSQTTTASITCPRSSPLSVRPAPVADARAHTHAHTHTGLTGSPPADKTSARYSRPVLHTNRIHI